MAMDDALYHPNSVDERCFFNATASDVRGNHQRLETQRPKCEQQLTASGQFDTASRERVWLWDFRQGISANAIASREGLSVRRVRFGVARASSRENAGVQRKLGDRVPWLVPLFPIGPYTPRSL